MRYTIGLKVHCWTANFNLFRTFKSRFSKFEQIIYQKLYRKLAQRYGYTAGSRWGVKQRYTCHGPEAAAAAATHFRSPSWCPAAASREWRAGACIGTPDSNVLRSTLPPHFCNPASASSRINRAIRTTVLPAESIGPPASRARSCTGRRRTTRPRLLRSSGKTHP